MAIVAVLMAVAMPGYAAKTIYVSSAGSNTSPYTNWIRAAHSIQSAVGVSVSGDTIIVSNGVYAITSQIFLPGGVSLTSQSGAAGAIILGNGTDRCVNMPQAGAVLRGFTITGGATTNNGGGVYCYYGTVVDCVITNNHVVGDEPKGGGVYCSYSTVSNCVVSWNSCESINADSYWASASGGGIYSDWWSDINRCVIEGNTLTANYANGAGINAGAGSVDNCTISGNMAYGRWFAKGGGVYMTANVGGQLHNCLIVGNRAYTDRGVFPYTANAQGGGVFFNSGPADLQNCTITGNNVDGDFSKGGGLSCGAYEAIFNTIICGNTATARSTAESPDYYPNSFAPPTLHHCLTGGGAGAAGFASGSYRLELSPPSPCIDAGTNLAWMTSATDLDGYPRISQTTVDIGAYEVTLPYAPVVRRAANVSTNGFTARWAAATAATNYYIDVSTNLDFTSYLPTYSNQSVGAVMESAVAIDGVWQEPYYYRVRGYGIYGGGPASTPMAVYLRGTDLSWFLLLLANN